MLWFDENVTEKLLWMSDYHVCVYLPPQPPQPMSVSVCEKLFYHQINLD